jgi:hypothetical protein
MSRERFHRRPRGLLLAVALTVLLAEMFAFTHPLDADAHGANEPCKICLGLGALGSADVGKTPSIAAVGPAPRPAVHVESIWTAMVFVPHRARAPPAHS